MRTVYYTSYVLLSGRGIDYLIGEHHSSVFITTLQALSVKKCLLRAAQCSVAERSVAQYRFLTVAVVCCRLRQPLQYYHYYCFAERSAAKQSGVLVAHRKCNIHYFQYFEYSNIQILKCFYVFGQSIF